MAPALPAPRGPLSTALIRHLTVGGPLDVAIPDGVDALVDDDLHLALWCCYELHHHGFEGVDDALEWDPETLAFRARLEERFEAALREEHATTALPADPRVALPVISRWNGPPLARTVEESGTLEQLREFAIHRSAYQLKEADPHTWAIPRLAGPGRSAMIEIQADEYGLGRPGQAHAEIFAAALRDLDLDDDFGRYLDRLPGTTLATDNLISLFALNRRLRGAVIGHLALFEMCSVVPMGRYLAAARRIGGLPSLERFYAVHVEADIHHSRLALERMVGSFADTHPELSADIVFGAAALSRVEARMARSILQAWAQERSSLLPGRPAATADPAEAAIDAPDDRIDHNGVVDLIDRPASAGSPTASAEVPALVTASS